jgi:hypothetical protein
MVRLSSAHNSQFRKNRAVVFITADSAKEGTGKLTRTI